MQLDENQIRNVIARLLSQVDTTELTVKQAITEAIHWALGEWRDHDNDAAECCLCDGHNTDYELGRLLKATETKQAVNR
jgi:hypothetical protein